MSSFLLQVGQHYPCGWRSSVQGFLVAFERQYIILFSPLSKETLKCRTFDLVINNLQNHLHFHNINVFQSTFTYISSFHPHGPVNNTFYIIKAIYKETECQESLLLNFVFNNVEIGIQGIFCSTVLNDISFLSSTEKTQKRTDSFS